MFCCSPDVGDCPHCHPEMWIRNAKSPWHWTSKFNLRGGVRKFKRSKQVLNKTRNKSSRRQGQKQKRQTQRRASYRVAL